MTSPFYLTTYLMKRYVLQADPALVDGAVARGRHGPPDQVEVAGGGQEVPGVDHVVRHPVVGVGGVGGVDRVAVRHLQSRRCG